MHTVPCLESVGLLVVFFFFLNPVNDSNRCEQIL